jgi:type IV pilus assembly protein PilN
VKGERDKQQRRLDETRQRISQLEKVIGEVNNLNKRKKEVGEKLEALDRLRKGRGGPIKLLDALSTAIPKKVFLTDFDEKARALKLMGAADSLDDVSEFMRSLNAMVWTPKGLGRVVEVKRDGSSARVELVGVSTIEDFPGLDVKHLFTNIELKSSSSETAAALRASGGVRSVKFELTLGIDYTI